MRLLVYLACQVYAAVTPQMEKSVKNSSIAPLQFAAEHKIRK
jgi:hypothetical protein